MVGKKRVLLALCCRLFGWFILSILTLGIGFLWFIPYSTVSLVCFYKQLQPNNEEQTS